MISGHMEGFPNVNLLQEGLKLLSRNGHWCIRHILREENELADALAKHAWRQQWTWSRTDAVPKLIAETRYVAHQAFRWDLLIWFC